MNILTVQAARGGADAAAQAIIYVLGLIGCAFDPRRNDMIIVYDELARQATLVSKENTLSAFFKVSGQPKMRAHIGRMTHTREIEGYMIHPIVKEHIPMYAEYVNVCRKGGLSCQ